MLAQLSAHHGGCSGPRDNMLSDILNPSSAGNRDGSLCVTGRESGAQVGEAHRSPFARFDWVRWRWDVSATEPEKCGWWGTWI